MGVGIFCEIISQIAHGGVQGTHYANCTKIQLKQIVLLKATRFGPSVQFISDSGQNKLKNKTKG